jgi:hypothetical protein
MRKLIAVIVLFVGTLASPLVAQSGHSVSLGWTAPADFVSGDTFNLYRGTVAGGAYAKVNTAPITSTTFVDTTVITGGTYFYVATHLQGTVESAFSNEAKAVILPQEPTSLVVTGVK